ncbi:MAG: 2Fe-2S iron-sulfur cluster-binding protein [Actinomycetota bacterium]
MSKYKIKAKIQRFDPEKDSKPYFQEYDVDLDRAVTVHELLTRIHRDYDGTLAYRAFKCYKGMCTTCIVKLDGKTVRSCATRVEPDSEITIEPAGGGEVVRDLVVDFNKM